MNLPKEENYSKFVHEFWMSPNSKIKDFPLIPANGSSSAGHFGDLLMQSFAGGQSAPKKEDFRPDGFQYAWPPRANKKNRFWRRSLRRVMTFGHYRNKIHVSAHVGGCPSCYAVEATDTGCCPEGPGFPTLYCAYCEQVHIY